MAWMPELRIGEFRLWPDSVYVMRGNTNEFRRYVPDDFSAISRENIELCKALCDVLKNADDTVWVGPCETLVDRLDDLGIKVSY